MFIAPTIIGLTPEAAQLRNAAADSRLRSVERVRPIPQDSDRFDLRDSRRSPKIAPPQVDADDRPATPERRAGDSPLRPVVADRDSPLVARTGAAFLAHVLGQTEFGAIADPGATVGSEAYRRAGGEPRVYPEAPAYFRLSA